MELKIMNKSKIIFFFIVLIIFENCNSQTKNNEQYKNKRNIEFKEYLIAQKIPFKTLNDSVFSAYYMGFIYNKKRIDLESNPNLKVNKVYVHFITPSAVEFIIYSDEETFCISSYDVEINGKTLGFPDKGVIKVLEPIIVEYFGDYELNNNIIKTKKRVLGPFSETYYHINGSIKNDTIYFTEKYEGKKYKFEKKFFSKKHKDNFIEVYQPNLNARKYINNAGLTTFEVTGEFNVEK